MNMGWFYLYRPSPHGVTKRDILDLPVFDRRFNWGGCHSDGDGCSNVVFYASFRHISSSSQYPHCSDLKRINNQGLSEFNN